MNEPLSILATLKETLLLTGKNFLLVLVTGIASGIASLANPLNSANHSPVYLLFTSSIIFTSVLMTAACRAALLAVLAKPPGEPAWPVIRAAVRERTLPLFCVSFILGLITIPWALVVVGLLTFTRPHQPSFLTPVLSVMTALIFFLFLKYALADPVVVIERVGAKKALKKSWQTTKDHFGYVIGCYLFLGLVLVLAKHFLDSREIENAGSVIVRILGKTISSTLNMLWTVLAWCMYSRIKVNEPASIEISL